MIDVLQWIRAKPELANVVVVVMSGSKNDQDIERAYGLGANSYLIKPTRFEEMVKMMEGLKDYTAWRKNGRGGAAGPTFNSVSSSPLRSTAAFA